MALVAALLELIRHGDLPATSQLIDPDVPAAERIATLMMLTDATVEAKIATATRGDEGDTLTELARRLVERKLPKIAARAEALEETRKPGDALSNAWDRALDSPQKKQRIAEECGVDPRSFCYRSTAMPLTGVEGDISPSGEPLRTLTSSNAACARPPRLSSGWGEPELLIDRSPILKGLSKSRWTTRRVFVREPLDSYSPRNPSPGFMALREHFEDS